MLRQRNSMSQHSWPGWEDFLSLLVFLCRDRVGHGKKKLCCDGEILCSDRVGQGRENFCRGGFLSRDRAGHDRKLHRTR